MNNISQGGLALAEHAAAAYRDNPKVRVILVGGSVARGCADEYSDLEIGIFWVEQPSEQERRAALARIGGELWAYDRGGRTMEHIGLKEVRRGAQHFSGTAMVSTNHMLVAEMERCLSDVLQRHDTDLAKQNLLFAIRHAVPLYGEAIVRRWQAQMAGYPQPLARRMVRENLWLGPWFVPHAYIGRDDRLVLYQHFLWLEQGIFNVLLGLNHIYHPSPEYKWMDQVIATMSIAPPNLSARMKHVFEVEPLAGWQYLKHLIDEMLDLVEVHMPEIDVPVPGEAHPEVSLAWARQRWAGDDTDPPYTLMRAISCTLAQTDDPMEAFLHDR